MSENTSDKGFEVATGIFIDYPETTVKEINLGNLELTENRIFISYTEPPKIPQYTKSGLALTPTMVQELELRTNNPSEYLEGKILLIGKAASEELGIHEGDTVLFMRSCNIIAEIGGVKGHMCDKNTIIGKKKEMPN